ncbi:MAG: hypothetical protein AAGF96_05945 [Bacteroidota bacterium]
MEKEYVEKELNAFIDRVAASARTNLLRHNTSRRLSRSIEGNVQVFPRSFTIEMFMEDYGEFQDKGVSGTERKYNTPFKFTNKRPPASEFDQWQVRKGLAGRNERGQFTSRRGANFDLANHIYKQGIRPKLFFTKAWEDAFKELPEDIIEAYGLDVEDLMRITLNIK